MIPLEHMRAQTALLLTWILKHFDNYLFSRTSQGLLSPTTNFNFISVSLTHSSPTKQNETQRNYVQYWARPTFFARCYFMKNTRNGRMGFHLRKPPHTLRSPFPDCCVQNVGAGSCGRRKHGLCLFIPLDETSLQPPWPGRVQHQPQR